MSTLYKVALAASLFLSITSASPAPTVRRAYVAAQAPQITPSPSKDEVTRTIARRGVISDVTADIGSDLNTVLSELGSNLPSWFASGIPTYFEGYPTGDAVASSLGLQSSELAALPTNVLNIDPYANWTAQGWNVRFHGNVYKQPNTSTSDLNDLANKFLVGTSIQALPTAQQDQARNLTAEIFVVQQGNVAVAPIHLEPAASQGSSGQSGGGGSTNTTGGTQDITLPYNTTVEGDFDVFVPILSNGLMAGNSTNYTQRLNTNVAGATLGNATAYLVPTEGLTIVSDIDDILRVTKIYLPAQGLFNTFAKAFTPWENMPAIYANWSISLPETHFHYLTTTPEQITRNYMQFIYANYPGGSFDTRPLNFSDVSATLSVRKYLLTKLFETFPQRKFILVGDVSNSDIMKDYPALATDFPNQVQCIFLRNTTATDDDQLPYDTSGFKDLNQDMYMFFLHTDDLTNLDIANGKCYNQTIPQNLTFSYQNLPDGLSKTTSVNGSANGSSSTSAASSLQGTDSVYMKSILATSMAMLAVFCLAL